MLTDYRSVVADFRTKRIEGDFVTLVPYDINHAENVVALRNQPHALYFFNQRTCSSMESQSSWDSAYLQRDNDIYWLIMTSDRRIVGTNRLYDIDGIQAEKGSLVIDAVFSLEAPYTLEAELLCLRFAFDTLGLERVVTRTRHDNRTMESINRRFGFIETGSEKRDGVQFNIFSVERGDFRPDRFQAVINHWRKRLER